MKTAYKPTVILAICGIALSLSLLLHFSGIFRRLENLFLDHAVSLIRLTKPSSPDVAVVLIDESSLQALNTVVGRWPWPRAIYWDLMEYFRMAGPKVVLMDILFTETQERDSGNGPGSDDRALVEATRNSGNIFHAMQLLKDAEDEVNTSMLDKPMPDEFAGRFALPAEGMANLLADYNNYYIPFQKLYLASRGIGVVEFSPDSDGVFRRTPPFRRYGEHVYPVMGIAPFAIEAKIEIGKESIKVGQRSIPVHAGGEYLLNFYGKFNTYSIAGILSSYRKIMDGDYENILVDPADFKDKIVFIGASAVGVEDLKPTPMSPRTPGVYLHATLASNYLLDDFLKPPQAVATLALMLIFAGVCVPATFHLKNYYLKLAFPLLLAAMYYLFCLQKFESGELYEFIPPLSSLAFSGIFSFGYLLVTEGKEKLRVKRMFGQYVSPEVLAAVMQNYEKFGHMNVGTNEEVTVLFTDIRSFTTISEQSTADDIVKMLNVFYSHMTELILQTNGTIDKFIGDAIMAYWGAPVRDRNHADKGVETAIKMVNQLKLVNADLKKTGFPYEVKIGVGMSTGSAIMGNIGSEKRVAHTLIGDDVNLASRLESMTKNFGARIIISESTHKRLTREFPCRVIDKVEVRGKHDRIKIYEVLCYTDEESRRAAFELCNTTNSAYDFFEEGNFAAALELYEKLKADKLGEIFAQRCREKLGSA